MERIYGMTQIDYMISYSLCLFTNFFFRPENVTQILICMVQNLSFQLSKKESPSRVGITEIRFSTFSTIKLLQTITSDSG